MSLLSRWVQRCRSLARRHSYSFFSSLGALLSHRLGTLMTVLVLGIAMLLPVGLHVTLSNFDRLELKEEEWGALTVFMTSGVRPQAVTELAELMAARDDVSSVEVVSPDEGLKEFKEASGFGGSSGSKATPPASIACRWEVVPE